MLLEKINERWIFLDFLNKWKRNRKSVTREINFRTYENNQALIGTKI